MAALYVFLNKILLNIVNGISGKKSLHQIKPLANEILTHASLKIER